MPFQQPPGGFPGGAPMPNAPPQPGFNFGGAPQPPQYGQAYGNNFGGEAGPGPYGAPTTQNNDDPLDNMNAFGTKAIRMGFIRKVYSILSVQLIITFGFVLLFTVSEGSKAFATRSSGLMIVAFVLSIGSLLTLACCGSIRRKFPHNYICLGIFTLAQSFTLGVVSAFYKTESVLIAVAMTAVVCIGLTVRRSFLFFSQH